MQKFSKISVKVGTFVKQINIKLLACLCVYFAKMVFLNNPTSSLEVFVIVFVFFKISVNRCYQNTYYQYMYMYN